MIFARLGFATARSASSPTPVAAFAGMLSALNVREMSGTTEEESFNAASVMVISAKMTSSNIKPVVRLWSKKH